MCVCMHLYYIKFVFLDMVHSIRENLIRTSAQSRFVSVISMHGILQAMSQIPKNFMYYPINRYILRDLVEGIGVRLSFKRDWNEFCIAGFKSIVGKVDI